MSLTTLFDRHAQPQTRNPAAGRPSVLDRFAVELQSIAARARTLATRGATHRPLAARDRRRPRRRRCRPGTLPGDQQEHSRRRRGSGRRRYRTFGQGRQNAPQPRFLTWLQSPHVAPTGLESATWRATRRRPISLLMATLPDEGPILPIKRADFGPTTKRRGSPTRAIGMR